MVYSTQNGQLCTICQQPPFVGQITKTHPRSSEDLIVTVGKVLSACGHAFHEDCINRSMYSGLKSCPNCRTLIDAKERIFTWTKDPIEPGSHERYFSCENGRHNTFFCPQGTSEPMKAYLMKNFNAFTNGIPVPGFTKTSEGCIPLKDLQNKQDSSKQP